MKRKLQNRLIKKYPKLFTLATEATPKFEYPIALWKIECCDGWYDLIDSACKALEKLNLDVQFTQVKQKFGGLKMYRRLLPGVSAETAKKAYGVLYKYEEMSYKVCEKCGKPGELVGETYVLTLCKDCKRHRR